MIITTEKAFDVLPFVGDIADKLKLADEVEKMTKKFNNNKTGQMSAGIQLSTFVIRNIGKVKKEVFEILSIIDNKTTKEIREQDIQVTIKRVMELVTDAKLMELFKSAME